MTDAEKSPFDEDAAIEAAQERSAVPHLRDVLKREHDEALKKGPRDAAIEDRFLEIEEMMVQGL
jgi:hypothetical protein